MRSGSREPSSLEGITFEDRFATLQRSIQRPRNYGGIRKCQFKYHDNAFASGNGEAGQHDYDYRGYKARRWV
jgi:hypothetical protein